MLNEVIERVASSDSSRTHACSKSPQPAPDETPRRPDRRNAPLDVLRALAIFWVVNGHAAAAFIPDTSVGKVLQLGGTGVDLFFVLSGWLLGQQLCLELQNTGKIDVRRFWLRRWLRTLPAYYCVLVMTLAWQWIGHSELPRWQYFIFLQNYLDKVPYFSVSWSLCVEEHFYLLIAPLLLVLFRGRALAFGLLIVLMLPSVCRFLDPDYSRIWTHTRFDPCMLGVAIAAISVFSPKIWERLGRVAPCMAAFGATALVFNYLRRMGIGPMSSDWGYFANALIFGSFVLFAVSSPWLQRRMRVPGTRFLSDRSYAVYLLHVEALAITRRIEELPFVFRLAMIWVISLALSEVLYRCVERPFMNMRERFAATRSSHREITAGSSQTDGKQPTLAHGPCEPLS